MRAPLGEEEEAHPAREARGDRLRQRRQQGKALTVALEVDHAVAGARRGEGGIGPGDRLPKQALDRPEIRRCRGALAGLGPGPYRQLHAPESKAHQDSGEGQRDQQLDQREAPLAAPAAPGHGAAPWRASRTVSSRTSRCRRPSFQPTVTTIRYPRSPPASPPYGVLSRRQEKPSCPSPAVSRPWKGISWPTRASAERAMSTARSILRSCSSPERRPENAPIAKPKLTARMASATSTSTRVKPAGRRSLMSRHPPGQPVHRDGLRERPMRQADGPAAG